MGQRRAGTEEQAGTQGSGTGGQPSCGAARSAGQWHRWAAQSWCSEERRASCSNCAAHLKCPNHNGTRLGSVMKKWRSREPSSATRAHTCGPSRKAATGHARSKSTEGKPAAAGWQAPEMRCRAGPAHPSSAQTDSRARVSLPGWRDPGSTHLAGSCLCYQLQQPQGQGLVLLPAAGRPAW